MLKRERFFYGKHDAPAKKNNKPEVTNLSVENVVNSILLLNQHNLVWVCFVLSCARSLICMGWSCQCINMIIAKRCLKHIDGKKNK